MPPTRTQDEAVAEARAVRRAVEDGAGARVFHLDLFEWVTNQAGARADAPLTLHVAGEAFPLVAHTAETRADARSSNAALALLPDDAAERVTHFAEVPGALLPADRVAHLHVTAPHPDPAVRLPSLLHVGFDVPAAYRLRNLQRRLAARGEVPIPHQLRSCGVDALPRGAVEDVWRDAGSLQTPREVAISLIFHHPQLGSIDPYAAAIVLDEHIGSPWHDGLLYEFAMAIHAQGQDRWSTVEVSTDADGRALRYEIDLGDGSVGDPVEIYSLTDKTSEAMIPLLQAVLGTVQADERLRGRAWASEPGVAAVHQPSAQPSRVALRNQELNWTLQDLTPDNGISADRASIGWSAAREFSIDVKNRHLRILGAYAQFFDDAGRPLDGFEWDSNLPDDADFETSGKKFLAYVPPRGSVMGIPVSVPQIGLSFPFPDNASTVRLLFGGLGTSSWDGDVCVSGTVLTGIFNYGVPTLFLVSTAGLDETKWLTVLATDLGLQHAAMMAGTAVIGDDATPGPMGVLGMFASAIGGMLVSTALSKLSTKVTRKMARTQFAGAVPFVGWAFKVAALAAGGAALAQTAEQTLSSPATLRIDVTRTTDLELTLRPDPEMGEVGRPETAVWPAQASKYKITVQYEGGTSFVEEEADVPIWETTSSDPLVVRFDDIPAGGWLKVIACILADNDWLCGQWKSERIRALPPRAGGPLKVEDRIEAHKVPLSLDTQYEYKERIVYDAAAGRHRWHAGDKPDGTLAQRSCANVPGAICEIASLAFNDSFYEIGFSWQAAKQGLPLCGMPTRPVPQQLTAFQSLSVLREPDSRLLFPSCALTARTVVAYDQFRDESAAETMRNFFVDPRSEPPHLRQLVLNGDDQTIDLDGELPSWGALPSWEMVDALAVHPGGRVVGASWASDTLAIVTLPEAGGSDRDAPVAALLAGSGERAGQLRGPRAMTVMPDGRIVVLESINRRVQAFDAKGNFVPSFDGERLAALAPALAADLDAAELSPALHGAFQAQELTPLRCEIPASFGATLDRAVLSDALRAELSLEGMQLSRDPELPGDPDANAVVEVVSAGRAWRIVDAAQESAHTVVLRGTALVVRDELGEVTIDVRAPGADWILTDRRSGEAFHLLRDAARPNEIAVLAYRSFMPLRDGDAQLEVLDVAAEAEGFMYVLAHRGEGYEVDDYVLDVYQPDGRFLTRTIGLNAARIVVNLWRSVYALSFDAFEGPDGRTEPTVAHWVPTPPAPE